MKSAVSLKTLLLDNDPTGAKLIELGNKVIKVFMIPRSRLDEHNNRLDLQQSGLYFLVGKEEESQEDAVYVGIATNLAKRFGQHKKDERKAFWRVVIACTTRDDSLSTSATN